VAGHPARHARRDVRRHLAGRRGKEPGDDEEVIPFGVTQLERPGERRRDLIRRSPGASLLQAHDVVDAQAGKGGEFLAPQSRRPAGSPGA